VLTNLSQTFTVTNPAPVQFYRAYFQGTSPVIKPVADVSVPAGTTVVITNAVTNLPTTAITFSLDPSAAAGASISANGVFTWTPACAQGSTSNRITVWATYNEIPSLSNSMSFNIIVGDCVQVGVGTTFLQTGQGSCIPVDLLSTVGLTNLVFTLSYPSNRLGNWSITATNSAVRAASVQILDSAHAQFQIATKAGQLLQGPTAVGTICFNALPGTSGFIQVQISGVAGSRADGSAVGNASGQAGRLVVIGPEPLLEASVTTNLARLLTLYGNPGASYQVDYATNLLAGKWQYGCRVPMTNLYKVLSASASLPQVFYRAFEFSANPPILELNSSVPSNLVMLVYGQKGSNYAIFSGTNLLSTTSWSPTVGFTLTNSFKFINAGAATNKLQFFRAKQQ